MKYCNRGRRRRADLVSCQTSCTQTVNSIDLSQPRLHFNKGAKDERISISIVDP